MRSPGPSQRASARTPLKAANVTTLSHGTPTSPIRLDSPPASPSKSEAAEQKASQGKVCFFKSILFFIYCSADFSYALFDSVRRWCSRASQSSLRWTRSGRSMWMNVSANILRMHLWHCLSFSLSFYAAVFIFFLFPVTLPVCCVLKLFQI